MIKHLFGIFSKKNVRNDSISPYNEKNDYIEDKKNNLVNEEVDVEEHFYIHKTPKKFGDKSMVMTIETPDSDPNGGGMFSYTDHATGKQFYVSPEQAAKLSKGNIPDGINVPGYVSPNSRRRPPQRQAPMQNTQPQQQPQQPQQRQEPIQNIQQPQNPNIQEMNQMTQPYIQQPNQTYNQPPQNIPVPPQQPQNIPVQPQQPQQPQERLYPPTEMAMTNGEYHVYVDLPGIDKKELKITYDSGVLEISGNRESSVEKLRKLIKKENPRKKKDPIQQGTSSVPGFLIGKFKFQYPFQKMVDESKLQAKYEDGILHVILPHRVKGEQVSVSIM